MTLARVLNAGGATKRVEFLNAADEVREVLFNRAARKQRP